MRKMLPFSFCSCWSGAARADDASLSLAANAAYLAANAGKPGTDHCVLTACSIASYAMGPVHRPGSNDVVRIAYSVRLINGKVVDTTNPALPSTCR